MNTNQHRSTPTAAMHDTARRMRYSKMSLDAASDPSYPMDVRLRSFENALSFWAPGSFHYEQIRNDYPALFAALQASKA